MGRLVWHRAGPQDYSTELPDGRKARVSGKYIDDREYDGGWHGWSWTAEIANRDVEGITYEKMGDAKNAVMRAAALGE